MVFCVNQNCRQEYDGRKPTCPFCLESRQGIKGDQESTDDTVELGEAAGGHPPSTMATSQGPGEEASQANVVGQDKEGAGGGGQDKVPPPMDGHESRIDLLKDQIAAERELEGC